MEKALIEKFFRKQCTPEEAESVAVYLKAHPSVLENYLSKNEWDSVVYKENLSQKFWDEVWQTVQKKNKAVIVSLRLKRLVAAASVVFIIAAAYYFSLPVKQNVQPLARIAIPKVRRQTIANTTKKVMPVVLEDSSVVLLSPASYISYIIPFAANKREIWLDGEASFHVAKNKRRPFTVYAGILATTALGTVFTITRNDKRKSIIIKLLRGKVVIRSIDKSLKGWNNDVYLLPGEQMKFNTESALFAVEKSNLKSNQNITFKNKAKQPDTDSLKNVLVFNNTKLSQVINKLSAFYNVHIQYDSVLIDTMNFTGTVSKNDSLPVILKAIAQMNELDILQNENGFVISKHQ